MNEQTRRDLLAQAKFSDSHNSAEYGTRTLYFDAPKELVIDRYPDAEAADISIEFPLNEQEAYAAQVMFGPVKSYPDGSGFETYDWDNVDLPCEDIEMLMDMAKQAMGKG